VVSAGSYQDHSKTFSQHSNDGQYFSYDEDDDEDEHEEEQEDNNDDNKSDDVHGQWVRNENSYYKDAKEEVHSLYLAKEDNGEAEDGDSKAINAANLSEHEVDSYPWDKVVNIDKCGWHKESSGGGLLRNFMWHSGKYWFWQCNGSGGGGSSVEKYFAGDGSMKGSQWQEHDKRKHKAKEEKHKKKTKKKLKQMDRKLTTVGVPRRKLERDHNSSTTTSRGSEEGHYRWMQQATGHIELHRLQPKAKDFVSSNDNHSGSDDVSSSSWDNKPATNDTAVMGQPLHMSKAEHTWQGHHALVYVATTVIGGRRAVLLLSGLAATTATQLNLTHAPPLAAESQHAAGQHLALSFVVTVGSMLCLRHTQQPTHLRQGARGAPHAEQAQQLNGGRGQPVITQSEHQHKQCQGDGRWQGLSQARI